MGKTQPLAKLLSSTRQYQTKALLELKEFISIFNDSLNELQITNKIDSSVLEKEIHSYLEITNWFKYVSEKITKTFFEWNLPINMIDKEGTKAQYKSNSDEYVNLFILEYIGKQHKKYFNTPMPELRSNHGIKIDGSIEPWHTIVHENGITIIIETVASAMIEYQRSYVDQLISDGLLPELSRIQKLFSSVEYTNTSEPAMIQVLESCTELYLKQYQISAVLLPFHQGNHKAISANIDKIYELYSPGKDQMVRKAAEMIKVLGLNNTDPSNHDKITEITNKSENKDKTTAKTPTLQQSEVSSVLSKPQTLKVTKEPVKEVESEIVQEPASIEALIKQYSEKKISDLEYQVVADFYIKKEHDTYSLYKKIVGKKDKIDYKLVSKKPFFVIAKTHHIEDEINGVRIASIDEIQNDKFQSYDLGAIEGAPFKKELNNKGYKVADIKMVTEYIHLLEDKPDIPLVTISNKVGWIDDERGFGFVLPKGRGIGIEGLEYSGENSNLKNAINHGGDLQEWLSIFDVFKMEEAHPRLQFLLFSSLMPLFAEYYPLFGGITINIGPDDSEEKKSSNGKSVMLRLLLSIQGNSTESSSSWFGNWKMNLQGLEKSLYTCVGSYHDDTSIKDSDMTDKDIEDIIYSISTAKSRETSVKDGRDRRTILFSSGESDILGHGAKDGAYARFINIGIKRTDYGSGNTKPIVDHIEKMTKKHFGFVYPIAIRVMLENQEAILSKIDDYQEELSSISRHDLAIRLTKYYAVIAVCGDIFIEAVKTLSNGTYDFSGINTLEVCKVMFKVHDQKLLDMDNASQTVSGNLLNDLLGKFTEDDKHILYNKAGDKVGFVENGNTYYIRLKAVAGNLPHNMPKKTFLSYIDKSSIIHESKGVTRKHINNGKSIRYTIFKRV